MDTLEEAFLPNFEKYCDDDDAKQSGEPVEERIQKVKYRFALMNPPTPQTSSPTGRNHRALSRHRKKRRSSFLRQKNDDRVINTTISFLRHESDKTTSTSRTSRSKSRRKVQSPKIVMPQNKETSFMERITSLMEDVIIQPMILPLCNIMEFVVIGFASMISPSFGKEKKNPESSLDEVPVAASLTQESKYLTENKDQSIMVTESSVDTVVSDDIENMRA